MMSFNLTVKKVKKQTKEELLERHMNGLFWIETHKCQPGTRNTLDVCGRVYEESLFEKACKTLEAIEDELNYRFPEWKDPDYFEKQAVVNQERIALFDRGFYCLKHLTQAERLLVFKHYFGEECQFTSND
jgi:hypothetical protein